LHLPLLLFVSRRHSERSEESPYSARTTQNLNPLPAPVSGVLGDQFIHTNSTASFPHPPKNKFQKSGIFLAAEKPPRKTPQLTSDPSQTHHKLPSTNAPFPRDPPQKSRANRAPNATHHLQKKITAKQPAATEPAPPATAPPASSFR
jgi:hypothetical protein